MKSIKSYKQEIKSKGVYYTPVELANYIKSLVDIPYKNAYDPTCGAGGLLSVFADEILKYGQDIDEDAIKQCNIPNFTGYCGDVLVTDYFSERQFDVIVANPPFSVKWQPNENDERFTVAPLAPKSKADYAFILHCLYKLKHDGVAVIMNAMGVLYRGNSEGKIRQYLIDNNFIDKVVYVAGDKFEDTKIATCILVLKKNKPTTDITFIDSEQNITKVVSYQEVKDNDYNLNFSRYIEPEANNKPVEDVDLEDLELQIRQSTIESVKQQINISLHMIELGVTSQSIDSFLDDLQRLVNDYRNKHGNKSNNYTLL